jgi:hypothetical protein
VRRLPTLVFAALGLATVAAFFVSQHLKTANPYVNFNSYREAHARPDPPVINPIDGRVCPGAGAQRRYERTRVGLFLQTRSQVVQVDVVRPDGTEVAVAEGSGRFVREHFGRDTYYRWNGRYGDGDPVPAGIYDFRVTLPAEAVSVDMPYPVQVVHGPSASACRSARRGILYPPAA